MKHHPLQPGAGATRETHRGDDAATVDRTRPAPHAPDDDVGRHGLHHDRSIHTEHEPFSVTSQRCRGEYP